MKKTDFIQWALRHGYEKDRWGRYEKTRSDGRRVHWKIQDRTVRFEVWNQELADWVRIATHFLSQIALNGNDQLTKKK